MSAVLIVLLFTGIVLVMSNTIKKKATENPKVIYKYLPRDLDTYLREDANQPSVLYQAMFNDNDVIR